MIIRSGLKSSRRKDYADVFLETLLFHFNGFQSLFRNLIWSALCRLNSINNVTICHRQ